MTINPGHLLLALHLLLLSLLACLLLTWQDALPAIPPTPAHPQCECCVPHQPSNVYSDDQHLVGQVKEIEHRSC